MHIVLVGLLVVILGVLAPQHSAAAAYGSEAHTKKAELKVEVAPRGLLEKIPNPLGGSYELSDFFNSRLGLDTDTIWKKTLGLGGQVQSHAQNIAGHVQGFAGHAQDFASQSLGDLKNQFQGATAQISEFQQTLIDTVSVTNTLRKDIILHASEDASERENVLAHLEAEFGRVLKKREEMLDYAFRRVNIDMKEVINGLGVGQEKAEKFWSFFEKLLRFLRKLFDLTISLAGKHPELLMLLLQCVARLIFPQAWILGILLRFFGFGSQGPVKGSAAAWAQRVFFGDMVPKGSWFADFQKQGMA